MMQSIYNQEILDKINVIYPIELKKTRCFKCSQKRMKQHDK